MIDSASSQQPPIFATQPHLPPLEDLFPLLQQIWESRVLTNNGPLHQQLEIALCNYLGVSNILLLRVGEVLNYPLDRAGSFSTAIAMFFPMHFDLYFC